MQNVNQICKPENQKEEKITIVLYMIDIQLIMCKQEIENVRITVDLKSFGYCSCAGSSPASSTKDLMRK